MILDLPRFIDREQPHWRELETLLARCDPDAVPLKLEEWDRLRFLYGRAAWALDRLRAGADAPDLERDLSRLVARAYGELYQNRGRFSARRWLRRLPALAVHFPRVFRLHARFFALALAVLLAGALLGGIAVARDPVALGVLLPANYLAHPGQRVSQAQTHPDPLLTPANESVFAAGLMTHNIQTALFSLMLGVTFGLGTAVLLFLNGALLGAVVVRYGLRGFGVFVAAWLLPHGVIEIPALLVGGQAGFLLASGLVRPDPAGRRAHLRRLLPDVLTLAAGLSAMLVWSGLIEAFYSQYGARNLLPGKIAFGLLELAALAAYLLLTGRRAKPAGGPAPTQAPATEVHS